jgi:hypothetical protein
MQQGRADQAARRLSWKQPTFLLALFLAAVGLGQAWRAADVAVGMDFYQFWAVGQALRAMPVQNIYADADRARVAADLAWRAQKDPLAGRQRAAAHFRPVLETYSTPCLYAALSVFRSSRYEYAFRAYHVFSLLCTVFAILLLCRLLDYSWTGALLALAVAAGFFEPLVADVRMGNVNQIQLAGLAALCWLASRRVSRAVDFGIGLAAGLLVLFKPTTVFAPLLLAWWWLVTGRAKRLALAAAGIAAALAVALGASALLFGSLRCWSDWAVALLAMPDNIIPIDRGNFALPLLLRAATGMEFSGWLTIVFLLPALYAFWRQRRAPLGDERLMAVYVVGLGGLIYLLGAKLVWLHYFSATIPLLLVGLRPRDRARKAPVVDALLPLAAPVMLCVTPLFGVTDPNLAGALICGGALLLYVLALPALALTPAEKPGGGPD